TCSAAEFACDNQKCLNIKKRCDGYPDCRDYTDEKNCPTHHPLNCTNDEYACTNGECIPWSAVCDNVTDCTDGGDEQECNCARNEFKCLNGGGCIEVKRKCDGIDDCYDGSDEYNCDRMRSSLLFSCEPGEFQCADGICIAGYKRCNGIVDCSDDSDEHSCLRRTYEYFYDDEDDNQCAENEFLCDNDKCILKSNECDGTVDCNDGTDELNCPQHQVYKCKSHEFRCGDGLCVDRRHLCDGIRNCPDASDEYAENCGGHYGQHYASTKPPTTSCGHGEWQCSSDECINIDFVCDGTPDCIDNSDEGSLCNINKDNVGSCQQDEFACPNDRCIPDQRVCDGHEDCLNGEDEDPANCPTERPPEPEQTPAPFTCPEHKCPSENRCYLDSDRCNGRYDCNDGYDEQGCPQQCASNEFTCGDGSCIPDYRKCDRRRDCRDGSDEINCVDSSLQERCRPGEWQCQYGDCIPLSGLCDGRPDCRDHSDERNCLPDEIEEKPCARDMFRCENGPCIHKSLRCDGVIDCPFDISDELDCHTLYYNFYNATTTEAPRLNLRTYPNEQTIKESK
ncbi:Low-density lipoprotein receptor-related protein 2, partial [Pseudolycoriella hygida]